MPWIETNAVDERLRFAHDFLPGQWSMTQLCERYGVTRPTGYTWIVRHPDWVWHARTTMHAVLERQGLLRKHRLPRRWSHPGAAALHTDASNQVWPADLISPVKTGDGQRCYPVTVTDHFSHAPLVSVDGLQTVDCGLWTVDRGP